MVAQYILAQCCVLWYTLIDLLTVMARPYFRTASPWKDKRIYVAVFALCAVLFFLLYTVSYGQVIAPPDPKASTYFGFFKENLGYGEYDSYEVAMLQRVLKIEGVYDGPITGSFHEPTRDAVTAYQNKYGIEPATGFFGPKTRDSVNLRIVELGYIFPEYIASDGSRHQFSRISRIDTEDSFDYNDITGKQLFVLWCVIVFCILAVAMERFRKKSDTFGTHLFTALGYSMRVPVFLILLFLVGLLTSAYTENPDLKEFTILSGTYVFHFFVASFLALYELITKIDIIGSLDVIMWPAVVLIIAFFFKKVFTYLFFSMEEFNFFGAKGSLIPVEKMIALEVEKKVQELGLKASGKSLEELTRMAQEKGIESKEYSQAVTLAQQLANQNKDMQQRLMNEIRDIRDRGTTSDYVYRNHMQEEMQQLRRSIVQLHTEINERLEATLSGLSNDIHEALRKPTHIDAKREDTPESSAQK